MRKAWILPAILAAVTVAASALLMASNHWTKDAIAAQKEQAVLRSLSLLIPDESHDNDLLADQLMLEEPQLLGHRKPMTAYLGYLDGQLSVAAIPVVAQNGYSGDIELLVGIRAGGFITAVEVIAHKETPGLGDLVERRKGDWLLQFDGKGLQDPSLSGWRVKKDGGNFDQITGATITPRAIVQATHKALNYFETQQKQWQQPIKQTDNEVTHGH